ncbi:MAG: hypothetical protein GF398_04720 [Chitinivibrionales bacterium]|nr:hypothetical protein [Chitinivibrionales bacterium]
MSIGNRTFFTAEHILAHKGSAPAQLAEQVVYCLELVAELVGQGLDYQFKGGNSLLVILQDPQRFSIDVDIATDEPREKIETCLSSLTALSDVFSRWEPRKHKTKPWIPLASYYLYFDSRFVAPEDAFIMLDVQLSKSPYATEPKKIQCRRLYTADVKVNVPTPGAIIGDKLLTLGPSTLGIPIGKGKDAQRIKHAFDVSLLLETGPAASEIRESFCACIGHEEEIQQRTIPIDEVVFDTLKLCASVAGFEHKPQADADRLHPYLYENCIGLPDFMPHVFARPYDWATLQVDFSRVALALCAAHDDKLDEQQFALMLDPVFESHSLHLIDEGILHHNQLARNNWAKVCSRMGRRFAELSPVQSD